MTELTTEEKRSRITWAYSGDTWLHTVSKMGPKKVDIEYARLVRAGRLEDMTKTKRARNYKERTND